MNQISDINTYTSRMAKSCEDKLFFMNKISDVKNIVDFGCADGTLIREMNKVMPNVRYIGYDNNPEMIRIAQSKSSSNSNISFTDTFPSNVCGKSSLLNLSSVIHEIYSYCNEDEIYEFWNNVFLSGFEYISIRDLCVSKNINRRTDRADYLKLIEKADNKQIKEFQLIWGLLMDNRNFLHFLMKYKYVENWDREVKENYFPITLEELLKKIPSDYEIVYINTYCLPYTKSMIEKDFGISIKDNTHVKLLLKKRINYEK
jgi:ribosomal protein L11 methylase PrmA